MENKYKGTIMDRGTNRGRNAVFENKKKIRSSTIHS